MGLEKLEKMAKLILKDMTYYSSSNSISYYQDLEAKVKNLINLAFKSLPDHQELFTTTYRNIDAEYHSLSVGAACSVIGHLLEIIEIEKSSETKIKEMKIFESAEDKMKQAGLSFRKGEYTSCFNNLNTALELVLKDKLRIPLTITKVNTSKIVDILVKHKVEPYLYLVEARKHTTDMANKIKHQSYSPSKSDCIFAMRAMEELISRIRNMKIELSQEVRNKIYEGL